MKKKSVAILLMVFVLMITGCGNSNNVEEPNGAESQIMENTATILEEPPALTVIGDNISCSALLGTYSWQRLNGDGTATAMEVDSAHPLDCKKLLVPLETTETTVTLHFKEEPDTILSVQCWSDEYWSDPAAESEAVTVNGSEIELKPGGYIYEVKAEWNTENGYGGIANYSFYVLVVSETADVDIMIDSTEANNQEDGHKSELAQDAQTEQAVKTGEINIDENITNVNEINAQGGDIEFADTMTYKEFLALEWTNDVDNTLASDTLVYVVKIYYPNGFEHHKVGTIKSCEAIGVYRADNGEYLGGSFRERSE